MKKTILFIFLLISMTTWSHSDRFFVFNYGNVTVRFKTGFKFEEIENAKLIGQYAALLCQGENYDQPILLDFVHDYGHFYKGKNLSFISIDSGDYDWISYYKVKYDSIFKQEVHQMIPLADTITEKDLTKEISIIKSEINGEQIVVRQFGFHFKIDKTLKLLQYAISHRKEILESSKTMNIRSYLSNSYYKLRSIPIEKINSITTNKNKKKLDEILDNKIYREKDSIGRYEVYHSYFFKNNKYHIFEGHNGKETIIDSVEEIYSLKSVIDGFIDPVFIFIKPNLFKFYQKDIWSKEYQESRLHSIPIDRFKYIVYINVRLYKNDIFEIDYHDHSISTPFDRFYYLAKDDILINNFNSYIDSHRLKKK